MKQPTIQHAFKEWAVICRALAQGMQALILRKGGIAEKGGAFQLEHKRFWLYPTYAHQQEDDIKVDAHPLLEQANASRPLAGIVRLSHWAEVAGVYQLHDLVAALKLNDLHIWSIETVQSRFAYRAPGLIALVARVWKAKKPIELPETPAYA
ncbi:MAG: DUF1802 family protein, partial [Candidatus Acidiferrum sp.]